MVCPLQRQKKDKYSQYSVYGKKWCFEVSECGYVSVFVCVCDHLVSFSGYSVRECIRGLVGLGVWVYMCVSMFGWVWMPVCVEEVCVCA